MHQLGVLAEFAGRGLGQFEQVAHGQLQHLRDLLKRLRLSNTPLTFSSWSSSKTASYIINGLISLYTQ